jgi:hypothetical protein
MSACDEHSVSNLWPLGPGYRCSPHLPTWILVFLDFSFHWVWLWIDADVCAVRGSTYLQSGFFVVFPDSGHSLVSSGIPSTQILWRLQSVCRQLPRFAPRHESFVHLFLTLLWLLPCPMRSKHPERLSDSYRIEKSQSQNPNVQIRHDHVYMRKNGVLSFQ